VKAWVETVSLAGSTLRVTAAEPLPADRETLAVASAIRVFERFPALDAIVLVTAGGEVPLARTHVEQLLAPDGFAALRERGRWPQVLARAVQRHAGTGGEGGA
jgi:hypothetical protein